MNTLRKLEYPTSLGQRSRSENEYPCLARLGSNRGIHFYQNLRDFTEMLHGRFPRKKEEGQ